MQRLVFLIAIQKEISQKATVGYSTSQSQLRFVLLLETPLKGGIKDFVSVYKKNDRQQSVDGNEISAHKNPVFHDSSLNFFYRTSVDKSFYREEYSKLN